MMGLLYKQVRTNLFGPKDATYSGYTCYTGIADFVPADIETVGYNILTVTFTSAFLFASFIEFY